MKAMEVHCSEVPTVGRTVDWEPPACPVHCSPGCYQPRAVRGRGAGVGLFLFNSETPFSLAETFSVPCCGTRLFLLCPSSVLPDSSSHRFLSPLPLPFINVLSMSDAILVSICWRIWTGPGGKFTIPRTVALYTVITSMASLWNQLWRLG